MKSKLLLFLVLFALPCWQPLLAQAPPSGFSTAVVSSQWDEAVGLAFNSTGNRMFVWERPGRVWMVENNQRQLILNITEEVGAWEDQGLLGFALDPQFDTNGYIYVLYVVDRHHLMNYGTPAYNASTNDYYSATIGRLTRYKATFSGSVCTVNPSSRKILIGATRSTGIPSTFNGHVTNSLVFGSDGTLLVSTGDGGHPYSDIGGLASTYAAQALTDGIITAKENVGSQRAQLVNCLSGKILRIDPSTGAGIPSNPFYDAANPNAPRSKVWALGCRNPFRMSLKPGTGSTNPAAANPGVLYIGDVGAQLWEEINVVDRPRLNLGWPLFEGLTTNTNFSTRNIYNQDASNPLYGVSGCTQQYFYFRDLVKQATPTGTATFTNPCNVAQAIPASIPTFVQTRPLIDWGHGAGPSRTGKFSGQTATTVDIGAVGSPVAGPQFGGASVSGGVFYPYTDFPVPYRNTYFFGDYVGGWIRSMVVDGTDKATAVQDFVNTGTVAVAFAVNPTQPGLYYVNFYPSEIRKITYGTTNAAPTAVATSNKTYGPGPLMVQFNGSASSDPEGLPLTYRWKFGDGDSSSVANPSHTFVPGTPAAVRYNVTLTVTDNAGNFDQKTLVISANNTPPQVTITSPVNNGLYPLTGNTVFNLGATVTDQEHSGSALSYKWQSFLHHASHEHPDPIDTTRQTTMVTVPYGCDGETYYYRIELTVTDAGGLSAKSEVRLNPDCSQSPGTFTLVNADTDQDIGPLVNGQTLNLATLPTRNLNVRANPNPAAVGSMVLDLSGAQTRSQTETLAPYALFSDASGDYNPWSPAIVLGTYSLQATPYSGSGGSGTPGTSFTANFEVIDQPMANSYTLAVTMTGSGTVSKSPDQATYASGSSVVLTATPAVGFQFSGWSGDATGSTNPLTVEMSSNKTITATFTSVAGQLASFTLVNADTDQDIQQLTAGITLNLATLPTRNLNIRANTSPTTVGSVVFDLSGAQTRSQTETLAPYALFSDVSGNYNPWNPAIVVGNYTLLATPYSGSGGSGTVGTPLSLSFSVIDQGTGPFTLTVTTAGSGTVSKSPNQATYVSGSNVVLTATPAAGFQFSGWSGDASGSTNPLTVSMTNNKAITATFASTTQYSLTVNTSGSGTVSKSPDQTTYSSGSSVILTATPAAGYKFNAWSGSATGSTNPLTVSMTANKTITATFVAVTQYTLTVNTAGSGTVAKNPDQATYNTGSSVILTATPAAGYRFSAWSGSATGSTNPLTVSMTANKTITATFVLIQQVSSFTLVNAATDLDIQTLTDGATLDLGALPTTSLNIRANTTPSPVGSVKFSLTGTASRSFTDNATPYALYNDTAGNYAVWIPAVGNYTLVATPYTSTSAGGLAGTPMTISFSVVNTGLQYSLTVNTSGSGTVSKNPSQATYSSGSSVVLTATPAAGYRFNAWSGSATGSTNPLTVTMNGNKTITASFVVVQQVSSFTLVNANTDADIQALTNGATLNLATLPTTSLNVRANTTPATVGSVIFDLGGTQSRSQTETLPPYALFSDANSDYNPWSPAIAVGNYTLQATPYTGSSGAGTAGTPLSISFSVVNQAARAAAPASPAPAAPLVNTQAQAPLSLKAYPNPSHDGQFQVSLSKPLGGAVSYTLVSALGQGLLSGQLRLDPGSTQLQLDFSRVMTSQGVYYLLLEAPGQQVPLKLMKY
jgi:glucose/arabinose dehydrogenase